MKFWQALVVAQMAAGAVWADRYHDLFWVHMLADAGNIVLALIMWSGFEWLFAPTPTDVEKDLDRG